VESCRPATVDDVARIAELARELRDELVAMRGGALWAARDARHEPLPETFRTLLDDPTAHVVVGTFDDVTVGFGVVIVETLTTGQHLARITELYVEEPARAVGVGEAICDALVAFGADHDVVGVDALALPGHRATKNFFEEQGFTARLLVMHHRTRPPT
jgi:GNAT superfamily N-acetyltransferase